MSHDVAALPSRSEGLTSSEYGKITDLPAEILLRIVSFTTAALIKTCRQDANTWEALGIGIGNMGRTSLPTPPTHPMMCAVFLHDIMRRAMVAIDEAVGESFSVGGDLQIRVVVGDYDTLSSRKEEVAGGYWPSSRPLTPRAIVDLRCYVPASDVVRHSFHVDFGSGAAAPSGDGHFHFELDLPDENTRVDRDLGLWEVSASYVFEDAAQSFVRPGTEVRRKFSAAAQRAHVAFYPVEASNFWILSAVHDTSSYRERRLLRPCKLVRFDSLETITGGPVSHSG